MLGLGAQQRHWCYCGFTGAWTSNPAGHLRLYIPATRLQHNITLWGLCKNNIAQISCNIEIFLICATDSLSVRLLTIIFDHGNYMEEGAHTHTQTHTRRNRPILFDVIFEDILHRYSSGIVWSLCDGRIPGSGAGEGVHYFGRCATFGKEMMWNICLSLQLRFAYYSDK